MADKTKLLVKIIRKIVKEEMEKNLRSMMLEEIGRATLQGKSLSFLREEVEQKEEKQIIKETPRANKAQLREELKKKLGIDESNPMNAVFDDVNPIDALSSNQSAEDPDDAGVDPSPFFRN